MQTYSWIKTELKRLHPNADMSKGVDLNGNGQLETNEKIADSNSNGTVGDVADWKAFAKRNMAHLKTTSSLFKWGAAFKLDNPLHDTLSIEMPHATPSAVKKVYAVARTIYKRVLARIARQKTAQRGPNPIGPMTLALLGYSVLTSKGKIQAIQEVMAKMGFRYSRKSGMFLTKAIPNNVYKCGTNAMLAMGIAHALGFKTHYVEAPKHAFIRVNDGKGNVFNYDQGSIRKDAYYVKRLRISPVSIRKKAYLVSLTRDQFIGSLLTQRASVRLALQQTAQALADAKRASSLLPNSPDTQLALGTTYCKNKDYRKSVVHLTKTIALDPWNALAYFNRGMAKIDLRDYAGQKADHAAAQRLKAVRQHLSTP